MKTIGILTYHWVDNFGANLQTLSTINYIKSTGNIPIVIDYCPSDAQDWYRKRVETKEIEAFKSFGNDYYSKTKRCQNVSDVQKAIVENGIEAVIIGSDSLFNLIKPFFLWKRLRMIRPTSDHVYPNPFFGGFNCKYAGLSISSQNCDYMKFVDMKEAIGESFKNFQLMTVRDDWTQEMVSYFTDGSIVPKVTPDPVFSFNQYSKDLVIDKEQLLKKFGISEKYMLFNFGTFKKRLPEGWIEKFEDLCRKDNIELVEMPHTLLKNNCKKITWPLNPLEWYYLIKYSNGYVGELMHPIVVSLHNCVPFFSFDHYGIKNGSLSSSKIYHIVNEAGLIENYYNINLSHECPSPTFIMDKLKYFEKDICASFSENQLNKCIENYNQVLCSIV